MSFPQKLNMIKERKYEKLSVTCNNTVQKWLVKNSVAINVAEQIRVVRIYQIV